MSTVVSLAVIFVLCCPSVIQGAFRYNLESCSDLVPKHITERFPDTYEYNEPTPSWQNGNGDGYRRRNRRETYNDSPFRITVSAKRYRKDANIYVQLEGKGYFDAMMMQGRAVNNGDFIQGGVGLVGSFEKLDKDFTYLECFRSNYATVVDTGHSRLSNATFVWVPPETDKGDIRFIAGVTKGGHYWIIVSSILHFNPFPISTVRCGGNEACFRVCPLDVQDLCAADNSVLLYNYNTDISGKREVEFTLGGKLHSSQSSYIAVVHAEDNDYLYQADVTVCYMENGRAKVEHYLMEVAGGPLIPHTEEIHIDDYDFDGNMLWCRYRRLIGNSLNSVVNPTRGFYTLLYRGEINPHGYPKLQTVHRSNMFSSDRKLNFSTPINEIYSGCLQLIDFAAQYHLTILLVIVVFKVNMIPYL